MKILAINPWIVDFAACDFWLKPYGFLALLTYLKNKKIDIDYIDCLDEKTTKGTYGRGKYSSQIIEKPSVFKPIPRYFKRYGIAQEKFKEYIIGKKFDYILITSSMTYWYPAIVDLVNILKNMLPNIPIILGGTYATLMPDHAKKVTGCDFIFKNDSLDDFFKLLGIKFNLRDFFSTLPSYEYFYKNLDYVVFRTSWGCPFNCSFCAIKKLFAPLGKTKNEFFRIPSGKIISFIIKYQKLVIKDFVLYDDAFLYEPDYAKNLLNKIDRLKLDINFHTPNALHLKFLDKDLGLLLKKSGFTNPHFGLETLDPALQESWGDKVTSKDLIKGIKFLKQGGFRNGQFSVYLLLGYPGQNLKQLKKDAQFISSQGARISLAEFSPVPGTKIFNQSEKVTHDPLLHNNSIFGFFEKEMIRDFWEIKDYVRRLNKNIIS